MKYSPDGSKLHISYEAFETYGAVRIQDAASVIPAEEYPRIFQKFYRGGNAGEQEGWGIGLYLARLILEQEQGYVKVEAGPEERKYVLGISPLVQREGNVTSQLGTGIFENPPSPIQTVDKVPGISRGFSFVVIHIFYIFSVFIKKKRLFINPKS